MENEKDNLFKIEYITDADIDARYEKTISELTNEQKSDYEFQNEYFYTIGSGHNSLYVFYIEYVTKSGIRATCYNDIFHIGDKIYKYKNNIFVDITPEPVDHKPIDFNNIQFPTIKNISAKTIGLDLNNLNPKD